MTTQARKKRGQNLPPVVTQEMIERAISDAFHDGRQVAAKQLDAELRRGFVVGGVFGICYGGLLVWLIMRD